MSDDKIKVLIVDDSAFMRRMIQNLIEQIPGMDVVGTAKDGLDALKKARDLKPDVITLDIEMPVMDGLTALENLQKQDNYEVIMISAQTYEGATATIRALELGAFDFISKPENVFNMPTEEKKAELAEKITQAYRSRNKAHLMRILNPKAAPVRSRTSGSGNGVDYIIAIGISTGGPRALATILPMFPVDLPAAVVIVQHMPAGFTKSLAKRLDETSSLTVKEAENDDEIKAGCVYIAPGNYHIDFRKDGAKTRIVLSSEPPQGGFRPSVDFMMKAIAASSLENVIAVIMTGMGCDGSKGLKELRARKKAYVIAQDENSCVVFGMPKAAVESGVVNEVVPLLDIPNRILNYMGVRQ